MYVGTKWVAPLQPVRGVRGSLQGTLKLSGFQSTIKGFHPGRIPLGKRFPCSYKGVCQSSFKGVASKLFKIYTLMIVSPDFDCIL